jgi:hypothetical protein
MGVRIDETNNVYGRLTVLAFSHTDRRKAAHWLCRCVCGATVTVAGYSLRRPPDTGKSPTQSCGCKRVEAAKRNRAQFLQRTRVSREILKAAFKKRCR